MSLPELRPSPDADGTAVAAARFVADAARAAVDARGIFVLALSGGSTPRQMLERLAAEPMPWQQVHVLQVDERVAPAGDAARNINMVNEALLDTGLLDAANLHPMPVEADDLDAAAARYATVLDERCAGVIDLVHLGLGDDGHTASLVPGDAGLAVTDRAVCMTGDYRGHRRMTLTYPTIDGARQRLWLCNGADKGPMLERLLRGDGSIPAGRVRGDASVVICDQAASAAAGV